MRDLLLDFFLSFLGESSSSIVYLGLWILANWSVGLLMEALSGISGKDLPAVPNHAHPLCLGHAVELGALLQILLAANSLGVAEACLSEGIDVTPCYGGSG